MRYILFVFVLLMVSPASAQSWDSIESLKPNTRIILINKRGDELKGKLGVVTSNNLELRRDGKTSVFAKDDVQSIYLTRRGSMLKRALIGAAAGAGVGVAIGVAVTVATKGDGLAAAGGFIYGIPAGAAIGAATTGRKRGKLIYFAN